MPVSRAKEDNSFKPYFRCAFDDGLKTTKVVRLPADANRYREIPTRDGVQRVSRIDGYTVEFAYPGTDTFVNLKVEQSKPESYADDKKIVIAGLERAFEGSRAITDPSLRTVTFNSIDVSGNDRDAIGVGAVLGIYIFFEEKHQRIVTIYFLNQRPDKRKAKTIEEYRTLRDHFLDQYTKCVTGPG